MSARGRKKNGEAVETRDNQETPTWVVHRLLEWVAPLLPRGATWLEPCAGRGAIIRAVEEFDAGLVKKWIAVEANKECRTDLARSTKKPLSLYMGDFFTDAAWNKIYEVPRKYPVALKANSPLVSIQNPPFGLALPFAEWCNTACLLNFSILRLNWIETPERYPYLYNTNPALGVLPNRPSFDGNGTDATAYAWFCWGLGPRYDGTWRLLNLTPADVRKEANRAARSRGPRTRSGTEPKVQAQGRVSKDQSAQEGLARDRGPSYG